MTTSETDTSTTATTTTTDDTTTTATTTNIASDNSEIVGTEENIFKSQDFIARRSGNRYRVEGDMSPPERTRSSGIYREVGSPSDIVGRAADKIKADLAQAAQSATGTHYQEIALGLRHHLSQANLIFRRHILPRLSADSHHRLSWAEYGEAEKKHIINRTKFDEFSNLIEELDDLIEFGKVIQTYRDHLRSIEKQEKE